MTRDDKTATLSRLAATCPLEWGASVVRSSPPLIRRWPLAPVRVGGHQDAVDVELKELFLIGADDGGNSGRDDGGLEIGRGLRRLCTAPNEELIVDVRRAKGVKSETGIASKISAFG